MARPDPRWAAGLAFAGRLGGGMYEARTALLARLKGTLGETFRTFPENDPSGVQHTLFSTRELAASANAILGFGRPEAIGWTDVRVFQYPGAGGILLHDDAGEWLTPYSHYLPYTSKDADSVVRVLREDVPRYGARIRQTAFDFVQKYHSSVVRITEALNYVGLGD